MSRVRIPSVMRGDVGGLREVETSGATVGEALADLVATYPALDGRVLVEGGLPTFINVFVDGTDVRGLAGLETKLADESVVVLLPAVAGG